MPKLKAKEMKKLISLVDDLYWDWSRMSQSGQATLSEIGQILEIESKEVYESRKKDNPLI